MNAKLTITPAAARAVRKRLDAATSRALHEIGKRAVVYARQNCPVDTGELRRSIGYRVSGNKLTVGASAKHAPYVEHGTGRGPPRPFLRPAITGHMDEYKRIIRREFSR